MMRRELRPLELLAADELVSPDATDANEVVELFEAYVVLYSECRLDVRDKVSPLLELVLAKEVADVGVVGWFMPGT